MTYDNEVWNEFELEQDGEALPEAYPEAYPESFYEAEAELEANLFQWIGKQGKRVWQTQPWLQRIARNTAGAAVQSSCAEAQNAIEVARQRAEQICARAQDKISQWESAPAYESEFESPQFEIVMEQLGKEAARAKSEGEALAFLAPLAKIALKKFGPKLVQKFAPKLAQGLQGIGKKLFANRQSRPLMRMLPAIANQTSTQLAQGGGDPRQVLARVTHGTLRNPRRVSAPYRRSQQVVRRRVGYGPPPPMFDEPIDDMSYGPPPGGDYGPDMAPDMGYDGDAGMDSAMEEASAAKTPCPHCSARG